MVENTDYRDKLKRLLTFIGGLYFVIEFLAPEPLLDSVGILSYHEEISYGFIVVGSMALGLGLINLFLIHGTKIAFLRKGWLNSAALLSALALMMFFSTADWLEELRRSQSVREVTILGDYALKLSKELSEGSTEVNTALLKEALSTQLKKEVMIAGTADVEVSLRTSMLENIQELTSILTDSDALTETQVIAVAAGLDNLAASKNSLLSALHETSFNKLAFRFMNEGLFVALGSAIFSLLGFYIAAAAYRAFRIRTFESSLMMLAALIVIFGQTSFTLRLSQDFSFWRLWLLDIPNSAAFRAIKIGAAVAGLVLAFRMWLSIESKSFSKEGRR